jgi:ferredoxin--NADP+ reductase
VTVAVIGSGPSGLYAVQALLDARADVAIHVFERERTPLGLVRFGVAPDHLKIRSMEDRLLAPLDDHRVTWHGGVEVGKHVAREDLADTYDAVVYATGAPLPRRLEVPGEDVPGVVHARDVIDWYNARPGRSSFVEHSAANDILVIGGGNVALDVARMLLRDKEELRTSDVPDDLLDHFDSVARRAVTIAVRRGSAATKFTAKELLEITTLKGVSVAADHGIQGPTGEADTVSARILAQLPTRHINADRRLTFVFDSVLERIDRHPSGRLRVAFRRDSGPTADDFDLVVGAVGYQRSAPWEYGRYWTDVEPLRSNEFLVGWAANGAQGLLAAARTSAATVASQVVQMLPHDRRASSLSDPEVLLAGRSDGHVTVAEWRVRDQHERQSGRRREARRIKLREYDEAPTGPQTLWRRPAQG